MSSHRRTPVEPESITPRMCSLDLRLHILKGLPFFAGLPAEDIARINSRFRERGYEPGEMIFYAGDTVKRLYVVASGKVKLLRHTLGGQDVLLDILAPGEFFGNLSALGGDVYPDTAQAQTLTCALSIEAEGFREIMVAYPPVALAVVDIMNERLRAAHEMMRQLSAHSAEQRIAHTLLKLGEKLGEPADVGLLIQMPLSREDLAAMAGATVETASRTLSQFKKAGLIRSGRQWVALADADGLRAIAEGDA